MADNSNPFGNAARPYDISRPPTLGQGTPSPAQIQDRRDLETRFNELPWRVQNFGAPVQTFARNIPVVGRQLSNMMAESQGMTPDDDTAIEGYKQRHPVPSFGLRTGAAAAPYMAFGPASIPGRMAFGAAVEGADAYTEGQDPIVGGGIGALGSLAASIPGRAVTPRSRSAVAQEGIARNADAWRQVRQEFETYRRSPEYRRDLSNWLSTRVGRDQHGAANQNSPNMRQSLDRERQIFDDQYRFGRFREIMDEQQYPTRQFPRRSIQLSEMSDFWRGVGAGAGGHLMGLDPVLSGAAGLAYGPVVRGAKGLGEKLINTPAFNSYYNNQLLGPDAQRFLYGAQMGAGQAAGGTPEELAPGVIPFEALMSQIRGPQ